MRRRTVETVLLAAFALTSLVAGGFLLVRAGKVSSRYGRMRVAIEGLVGMLLGGVLLYEGITR